MLGNVILAASSTKPSSSSSTFLLIIVVIIGIFYFVMIRPQSKKRRQVMEQQRAVQPGQRVRTTAGMYATVVAVDDSDVVLEVAPGVQVRYVKRAIMEVLPDDSGEPMAGGADYAAQPFDGADQSAADDATAYDLGDAEPVHAGEDAPASADGDISAHLGDGSPNGSTGATAQESRAPDSV